MKRYLAAILTLALSSTAQADLATDWVRTQRTAVLDWQHSTQAMVTQLTRQCDRQAPARLNGDQRRALMPAWQRLASAWGVVASQAPAAIDQLGLAYRVAFWPDSRGIVARQLSSHQQQLQNGKAAPLHMAGHGIQGLDWMLARPEPDCRQLLAWADHYSGYVDQVLPAMPERLRLASQALNIAANDLYSQASRINQRLREVMAQPEGRFRPFMGDLSETGQSLRMVRAGLNNLGERIAVFNEHLPDDQVAVSAAELKRQLGALATDLPDAWPGQADQAWALIERVQSLNGDIETWLAGDVATTYSLLIGFNNQDGD